MLLNIFKGELRRNFDNKEFIDSEMDEIMRLRFLVLSAARIAFHYAIDCFVMGEFDISDDFESFKVSKFFLKHQLFYRMKFKQLTHNGSLAVKNFSGTKQLKGICPI